MGNESGSETQINSEECYNTKYNKNNGRRRVEARREEQEWGCNCWGDAKGTVRVLAIIAYRWWCALRGLGMIRSEIQTDRSTYFSKISPNILDWGSKFRGLSWQAYVWHCILSSPSFSCTLRGGYGRTTCQLCLDFLILDPANKFSELFLLSTLPHVHHTTHF